MILGRWEVHIADKTMSGPGSFVMARLHSRKRAEERAKYVGGRVVDRKMWRGW